MTDLQAPAPPTAPADLPIRPRRRLVTGLVVAGLAAATVTAGLVTGVVGPSPLVEGHAWGARVLAAPPAPGAETEVVFDAVEQVTNVYGYEYRVSPQDGRWLDLTASLENRSPVPVRITGISSPLADGGRLDVVEDVQVTVPADELGDANLWRPLGDGVVVPPGVSWRVRLVGRLDTACEDGPLVGEGVSTSTDEVVDVDYEVLGVPRHAAPTMSWTVSLVGPFHLRC